LKNSKPSWPCRTYRLPPAWNTNTASATGSAAHLILNRISLSDYLKSIEKLWRI